MIELRTLGRLSLTAEDGRELRSILAQPKRVALLAYLASPSTPAFVSRESLLGLLWPERDQKRARSALRSSLHFLRRSLGRGVLVSRSDQDVGLDSTLLMCDAAAFRAALDAGDRETALDLHGGEYLPGLALDGARAFEEWLDGERRRLRRLARDAALELARAAADRGDLGAAESRARRAMAVDGWDEAALRVLLEVLAAQGKRPEAVRTYERFEERVREELQLEPSRETRELAEGLRHGEEALQELRGGRVSDGGIEPEPPTTTEASASEGPIPGRPGTDALTAGVAVRSLDSKRPGPTTSLRRRILHMAAVSGLVLALVLVWRVTRRLGGKDGSSPAVAAGAQPAEDGTAGSMSSPTSALDARRVLVAPLDNRTGDSTLDALGRIAADRLTRALARTGLMRVVPAFEADIDARYLASGSGERPDYSSLGRRLAQRAGAAVAVTGAYYKRRDSLVFDARLIDTKTGEVLRTAAGSAIASTDPLVAVEALRPRLLGALGTVIDPRLASWSAAAGSPPSYDAYLRYEQGLDLFFENRQIQAAKVLQSAGDLSSGFAAPLLWAAFAYSNAGDHEHADSLLLAIASDSLRLAPWDRAIFDDLNAFREGDPQAAYEAARRVVEISPGSEWTYELAWTAGTLGHFREAVHLLKGMNPEVGWIRVWPSYWFVLAQDAHLLGDLEEARRAAQEGVQRFPGDRNSALELALDRAASGESDSAAALLARPPLAADSDPARAEDWGLVVEELHVHGHRAAARRLGTQAWSWYQSLPGDGRNRPVVCHAIGMLLATLGRLDDAHSVFRRGLAHATGDRARYLRSALAVNAAARGDTVSALRALAASDTARWEEHPATQRLLVDALILANLGRRREAVAQLREALGRPLPGIYLDLHSSPSVEPLRGYPPFEAIVHSGR